MLTVGIPKEIKIEERRVALTPKGVRQLAQNHVRVLVQRNAGTFFGFSDRDYETAGAVLSETKEELWSQAELIKKVKEPIPEEFPLFKPRHIIFTYLHLASPNEHALLNALIQSKVAAIGYETIERDGTVPLLKPMSEVAGTLAAYFAGIFRNYISVKNGKIFGLDEAKAWMEKAATQYPQVLKNISLGTVVILGGGHVGEKAAQMASALGGKVFLSEISDARRSQLDRSFKTAGLSVSFIDPKKIREYEEILAFCDTIISAVHVPGKRAPLIIDSTFLRKISERKKKIILDIAIDQGGNIIESRPTNYEEPLYLDSCGNIRFSVTNMPSLCARGASVALEEVSLDYTLALTHGIDHALAQYPELKTGVNILNGKVILDAIKEAHGLPSR